MDLMKEKMKAKYTMIIALALIAILTATAFGTSPFIISNLISEDTDVVRTNSMEIIVPDFPDSITIGKNYTFNVTTQNLADQNLTDLTTLITISYTNGTIPIKLNSTYFYIYYEDSLAGSFGVPLSYAGEIQNTFDDWNGTHLISTALGSGSWNAIVDYINKAKVTFRIEATSPLNNGTLTWNAWVEAPSLP